MTYEDVTEVALRELPTSLRRIARLSSVGAAVQLARAFGGRYLYVPQQTRHDHPIALAVGLAAAHAISGEWGGGWLYVPRENFVDRKRRDTEIRARFEGGDPASALADEYGLSNRQVWRICAKETSE